jgi:PKD repeat protein
VSLTTSNTQGSNNLRKTNYIEVKRPTGINSSIESLDEISIYPNPCSEWIEIDTKAQINTVELFALDGSKVLSEVVNTNKPRIQLPRLESGLYLLSVNQNLQYKIVINQ